MRSRCRERGQEGYVLLALLATSAVMLVGLALAIPRAAMQAQRVKDQELIRRGEDYKRAIRLYYQAHKKYPEEIEDLEETDNVRFLRKRSEDPMGESGEWRIIHMGADGRFEDSLLFDTEDRRRRQMGTAGAMSAIGGSPAGPAPTGAGMGAMGLARGSRAAPGGTVRGWQAPGQSDPRTGALAPGGAIPAMQTGLAGPGPWDPAAAEPLARMRAARQSAAPDLAEARLYSQGFQFNAGESPEEAREDDREILDYGETGPQTPDAPHLPGSGPRAALRGFDGLASLPSAVAGMAPPNPSGLQGMSTVSPEAIRGSGARELVNRLLTTPRQGGLQGTAAVRAQGMQPQLFQRGIAGVASKSTKRGVRVYNDKLAYSEWEFLFDYRTDQQPAGIQGQAGNPSGVTAGQGRLNRPGGLGMQPRR